MSENKIVKAKCKKTGKFYALEVRKFGSTWKVVNMTHMSDEEGRLLSSEVEQSSFETNTNLLACSSCKSRRIGGCSCPSTKGGCSKGMKYRFDCVYCKELEIDYSLPDASDVGSMAGKKITLTQGQEVEIRCADNKPLSKIYVGIGWDPAAGYGSNMDVDSSVVLLNASNDNQELIYFGHLENASGSIVHHGDNLTGNDGDTSKSDDENITVELSRIPHDTEKLVFVLNIYDCISRGQTLDKVKNLYIKLYDPNTGKALIEYRVTQDMYGDTGIVIGMAYRRGSSWMFKAIGKSLKVNNLSELETQCKYYI